MVISLIAALSENRVIGKNKTLPWRLPDDMKFFMQSTKGHFVIMGRKNYESIPEKFRPLPNRTNVVVTRQKNYQAEGCRVVNSVEEGLHMAEKEKQAEVFIIGGADIYRLGLPMANRLYLTEIHASLEGDTFFPPFDKKEWTEISRRNHGKDQHHAYSFDFVLYEKKT